MSISKLSAERCISDTITIYSFSKHDKQNIYIFLCFMLIAKHRFIKLKKTNKMVEMEILLFDGIMYQYL